MKSAYHTNGVLYGTVGVLITQINVWLTLRSQILHHIPYSVMVCYIAVWDVNHSSHSVISLP